MNPLKPYEIRDFNREIAERTAKLKPLTELCVVRSYKKGKCYGIGMTDPEKDLILRNLVRPLGGMFRPAPAGDTTTNVSLTDITNAARTVVISSTGATMWTGGAAGKGKSGSALGFGNPALAPTPARTDFEIDSKVAEIIPSGTTTDEVNWRIIVTGSYVWAAGGTVRCAGFYDKWYDNTQALQVFLIYYDAVGDVVVGAGGTVSVTYTTQL